MFNVESYEFSDFEVLYFSHFLFFGKTLEGEGSKFMKILSVWFSYVFFGGSWAIALG